MTTNNDGKIESESLVKPDGKPEPVDRHALPFEFRARAFADEYNELCRKWNVGLKLVTKEIAPQYHVTELQPVPLEIMLPRG